jgi:transposase
MLWSFSFFRQGSLMSQKKYVVSLTDEERAQLKAIVKKLVGTSQKVKRANILLKADDCDGKGWTDTKIAEACDCTTKTVENIRQRFVETGFEETLNGKMRKDPPVAKLLDGEQEAKIIALRLGDPPAGFGKWSLRLLARRAVELKIADAVSYKTIGRMLKKTK